MSTDSSPTTKKAVGAFDIRRIIGALIGIYGVILTVLGLFFVDDDALARADGINVNLWTGLGLLVAAALMELWAKLRPLVVAVDPDEVPSAEG